MMDLSELTSFPGIASGSVFLIVGGSGAIGSRCAQVLLSVGARVAIMGRSPDRISEVVTSFSAGNRALGVVGDISLATDDTEAVAQVINRWGQIDGLINAAAVSDSGSDFFDVTEAEIDAVLGVNLRGAILIAQAAARAMAPRHSGRIVNISSIAAHRVQQRQVAYATSKAGLAQLTRQLAVELGPRGITVNCVSPGQTPTHLRRFDETPGLAPLASSGTTGSTAEAVPLRRRGVLDDFVGPILFLCSALAGYVTGADLAVEGGVMLARPTR